MHSPGALGEFEQTGNRYQILGIVDAPQLTQRLTMALHLRSVDAQR